MSRENITVIHHKLDDGVVDCNTIKGRINGYDAVSHWLMTVHYFKKVTPLVQ